MKLLTISLLLCCALLLGSGQVLAQDVLAPVVEISVEPSQSVCQVGKVCRLVVVVNIKEPYHINNNQPSSPELIPTSFTIMDAEPGITLLGVSYPPAQKLQIEGEKMPWLVWSGIITLQVEVMVGLGVVPGTYKILTILNYQACDDQTCQMPDSASAELVLSVVNNIE